MQKSLHYILVLTTLFTSTLYGSTKWIFDKNMVVRQADDEIDYCLQPGMQPEDVKSYIQFLKNDKIKDIVYKTEIRHRQQPFNNEREAKEYVKQLAHEEARQYYRKIVRQRIEMRLSRFPSPAREYTQKIKDEAEKKLTQEANNEMYWQGRLTNSLKNVDRNLNANLQEQLGWTRDVSNWLATSR